MTPVARKTEVIQKEQIVNRGIHREFIETFSTIPRNTERWKIKGAGNRSDEYTTHTADRIRKLSSGNVNVPSLEGSNDSTTDRSGQRKQFRVTGSTKC